MSGSYGVGANYLSFTAGTAGAAGTGAYTIVVLVQPAVGNNSAGMCGLYTSGSATRDLFEDALALYGTNDFSSGFGPLVQGNWYVAAQTKAAGSATYRHHLWAYASDASGTMSHGVSAGSSAQGDGSAITEIRIGATEVQSNGLIAAVAVWTVALSDADLDGFVSTNLSDWTASGSGQPSELISLENWNGTTGASVLVGTSAYSSATGTVNSSANPTGFDFSLGQTFTASLAGASTPAGALARQSQKSVAAACTPSGATAKQPSKAYVGSSAPGSALAKHSGKALVSASATVGAITRQCGKAFSAASGPSSLLTTARTVFRSLGGESAPAGALTKSIAHALSATSSPSGVLTATGGTPATTPAAGLPVTTSSRTVRVVTTSGGMR